ncbi:hypothetical protein Tco_1284778, partial [Tanacetum coccineum]
MLFGIGIPPEDVRNVARAISCSHDSLPFTYLGLPAGRNLKKVEAWSEVVDKTGFNFGVWSNIVSCCVEIYQNGIPLINLIKIIWLKIWSWWSYHSLFNSSLSQILKGVEPETLPIQAPVEAHSVLMSVTKDDDATSLPVAGE